LISPGILGVIENKALRTFPESWCPEALICCLNVLEPAFERIGVLMNRYQTGFQNLKSKKKVLVEERGSLRGSGGLVNEGITECQNLETLTSITNVHHRCIQRQTIPRHLWGGCTDERGVDRVRGAATVAQHAFFCLIGFFTECTLRPNAGA
jgi:hypothetical protein